MKTKMKTLSTSKLTKKKTNQPKKITLNSDLGEKNFFDKHYYTGSKL